MPKSPRLADFGQNETAAKLRKTEHGKLEVAERTNQR